MQFLKRWICRHKYIGMKESHWVYKFDSKWGCDRPVEEQRYERCFNCFKSRVVRKRYRAS